MPQNPDGLICRSRFGTNIHQQTTREQNIQNILVCSCDLDLDLMTLIYELNLDMLKMYLRTKKWSSYRSMLWKARARTDRLRHATKCITTLHSWVEMKCVVCTFRIIFIKIYLQTAVIISSTFIITSVVTTCAVPSAPPAKIHATMVDNTTMYLTWEPPPPQHLNGPLLGYKVNTQCFSYMSAT